MNALIFWSRRSVNSQNVCSKKSKHSLTFLVHFFALLRGPIFFFHLSLCNLIGNVYPIWLQRYNRIRVGRVMGRLTRLRPSS